VDRIRILYFLEDRAQENFVKYLVQKIASEVGISSKRLMHDIRSARGGSIIINEFKKFVKSCLEGYSSEFDLVIVAVDGNCKGYQERKKELEKYLESMPVLEDRVVFAIPDPHIERWYMLDQKAFRDGVGIDKSPGLPTYKCQKDYYKKLIYQVLHESKVNSLLGGIEYAERIIANLEDLELLGQRDPAFKFFVNELKRILKKEWSATTT
jgi:hypothetical protein